MARILVVDDEPLVRGFLRRCLENLGHEVVELDDGKHASRTHAEHPVDLMITDLFMPNRDGLQTIFDLHQNCPELRIIAISGGGTDSRFSGSDMLRIASRLGACKILEKPFGINRFRETVNDVLGS
jgi:DNA-binding NtrC family response regulator